jgi:SAM-dependent methyltransferase
MDDEVLQRLTADREQADRLYKDAVAELQAALLDVPELPAPPAEFDAHQLEALNTFWDALPENPPHGPGWRRRALRLVWPLVRRLAMPLFRRQLEFNSAVVDHVNRNVWGHRDARAALARTIAVLGTFERFQTHLITYVHEIASRDVARVWESMAAREQRFEARVRSLTSAHDELRTHLATLHQTSLALRREIERVLAAGVAGATGVAASRVPAPAAVVRESRSSFSDRLASYKYVGFEDMFRGSQEDIGARMAEYLTWFAGASDVLDVGCGRGEFLELLRAKGVRAQGVDINHAMVEDCRARGLNVVEGDGLAYLDSVPDGSLGGLFAAQVVEHLEPVVLERLLEVAYQKLRPGARIVLETINPSCWFAFFESYVRDLSHVQPVHAETLKYLLQASGFQRVEVRYRAPYPAADKLQPVPVPDVSASASNELHMLADLALTFNANIEKTNSLMFTYLDYAAVGERL